jgi:hypothetical protein
MPPAAALPFVLKRSEDKVGMLEVTSKSEIVHGLIKIQDDKLVFQWRVSRSTDIVGFEIRTEKELEPVQQVELPLSVIAGAVVRWKWNRWPPGRYLILTASDLYAFEIISGEAGLKLDHPAEMAIRLRRAERSTAEEFAAELNLVVAERSLRAAEGARAIGPGAPNELSQLGPRRVPETEPRRGHGA